MVHGLSKPLLQCCLLFLGENKQGDGIGVDAGQDGQGGVVMWQFVGKISKSRVLGSQCRWV